MFEYKIQIFKIKFKFKVSFIILETIEYVELFPFSHIFL